MKYNLHNIMHNAWSYFRKYDISFAEALHRAWQKVKCSPINENLIQIAKMVAGVSEEVNTWSGWYDLGYEVIHGSKRLFQVELIHASKGDGVMYKASFFGRSQVVPVGTQPPKESVA